MALFILRIAFVAVMMGVSAMLVSTSGRGAEPVVAPGVLFAGLVGITIIVVGLDVLLKRKRLDVISAVYFGLIVGLFLAQVVGLALGPLLAARLPQLAPWAQVVMSVVLSYVCISLLLQTRHDFRFIIPYVEFAKDVKGMRPYVVDTSAVIDGRIVDLVAAGMFDGRIVVPAFVIAELQLIADSGDKTKRQRGRRGLDILHRLRTMDSADVAVDERELAEFAGQPVDLKLVLLARHVGGRIVTTDYNLNKVARLHNLDVVNVNDLASALKPAYAAGDSFDLRIAKPGEEPRQGVGYLDDGTMVVVEGAREQIGETIRVAVTSVLQTSSGRMVFAQSTNVGQVKRPESAPSAQS